MCGIVGYVGRKDAVPVLMDCLSRLEYRGYDSAGIATLAGNELHLRKTSGKNQALANLLQEAPIEGSIGIAHTRWATHGAATAINAHPHADCKRSLVVVHNGIIENHSALREDLESAGHRFVSETDSETVAHLFEDALGRVSRGSDRILDAAIDVMPRLKGAYAIATMSREEPGSLLIARNFGAPLIIGYGADGVFVSSDASAILCYTRDVRILGVGEMAIVSASGARITKFDGTPVEGKAARIAWRMDAADKGDYAHYMLKEIYEQPDALDAAIRSQDIRESGAIRFPDAAMLASRRLNHIQKITVVACGTSWHAALIGKYLIESIARIPVEVDIASEFRYRPGFRSRGFVVAISQSGETADTLGAVESAQERGCRVLSICNVEGSSMSRTSDGVIYTHAGPEIGVASTKAFTTQLVALYMLAVSLAVRTRKIDNRQAKCMVNQLMSTPELVARALEQVGEFSKAAASRFSDASSALFLGRGIQYPVALEGALKLKEISYIHAEGYPAGEMKHGPIALVDGDMPVVAIMSGDCLHDKTLANVEEVRARGGRVNAVAIEGDTSVVRLADHVAHVPRASDELQPVVNTIPLQLLAYYTALARGCDVDKPRNLAKSVTVE